MINIPKHVVTMIKISNDRCDPCFSWYRRGGKLNVGSCNPVRLCSDVCSLWSHILMPLNDPALIHARLHVSVSQPAPAGLLQPHHSATGRLDLWNAGRLEGCPDKMVPWGSSGSYSWTRPRTIHPQNQIGLLGSWRLKGANQKGL